MRIAVHAPNLIADGGEVELIRQGDHVRASCTCPAGVQRRLCAHALAVLQGRTPGTRVADLIAGSQIVDALGHYVMTGMAIEVMTDARDHHRHDLELRLFG